MTFKSIEFLFLISITFLLFWFLPNKLRPLILFIASFIFYGFTGLETTLLFYAVLFLTYIFTKALESNQSESIRSLIFVLGLMILFSPLIYYKYANFIFYNINSITTWDVPFLEVFLPVGISFYTFQAIGNLIDVYKRDIKPCKSFFDFALFISFFPQLVAGPIERTANLLPQLFTKKTFDPNQFNLGLKVMAWGFFKKIVIADRIAHFVDPIYNNQSDYSGITLLLATFLFAFQIYCDFSGYSDIAIGTGKLLGIDLMKNFDRPYFATSIVDFWRRWHISLSTWFKDYIYMPLGGSQVTLWKWVRNILIVFIVSGIWHGARWTFVIWGLTHGLAMIVFRVITPAYIVIQKRFLVPLKISTLVNFFLTFVFVNLTWIFFRANTLADAWSVLNKIYAALFNLDRLLDFPQEILLTGFTQEEIIALIFSVVILLIFEYLQFDNLVPILFSLKNIWLRRVFQYLIVISVLLFGYFGQSPFIYFQF